MTTLYGIPNCDTVKKARKWLESQGVDYRFHDFRADGITAAQVKGWLKTLGAETLVNRRSTTWKQLSEAERDSIGAAAGVTLIVENPTLIKRPLLETGSTTQVGFKAADYEALFA